MKNTFRSATTIAAAIGILQIGLICLPFADVHAQAIPGLVVSTPEQSGSPSPTPAPRASIPSYGRPTVGRPATAAPPPRRARRPARKPRQAARHRPAPPRKSSTTIVLLVNDDPITEYEVVQRARLMSLRANLREQVQSRFRALIKRKSTNQQLRQILKRTVEENRGRSRDAILKIFERRKKAFAVSLQKQAIASARSGLTQKYRQKAVEELIEERLKLHEAKRLKIAIDNKMLDRAIDQIAKRNKMSRKQFENQVTRMGVDFMTMRERIRAQLSWQNVVRASYSRIISVNQRQVDELLATQPQGRENVTFKLHRITLPLPPNIDQATLATRLSQADALQRRHKGCKSTRKLASAAQGAQFEDLGTKSADTIPEPTRSLLLNATDGQMVPPATTTRGIELYVVCSRAVANGSLKAQAQARALLRQKEFNIQARRHLMNLKRDAHIERRG